MKAAALGLDAPAKVNLSLAVTGRRRDGYHELVGVMALLELADTLVLTPGCSGLRVSAPPAEDVPVEPRENLAWRGLVTGAGEEPALACLTLEKRIPAAAGLGGGSSDAAAGWRLGRRHAGHPENAAANELAGELVALGADVPFFAAQAPAARVTGIGEQVEPLPPASGAVLLVIPPFRLATATVFAELRGSDWSQPADAAGVEPGHNDLLAPALRLRPELGDVLDAVRRIGAEPHLTGSGPACFAVVQEPDRAVAMAAALAAAGLRTISTRFATRAAAVREHEATADLEE